MSANAFDQFDVGQEKPEGPAAGNAFNQFDEPASNDQRAGNAFDQFDDPAGAKISKADRRIQTLMDGWGEVEQQPAFRKGDRQQRQRLRGDYINNSLIRGLSGSEYDDVFGPFMSATEPAVFGERPQHRADLGESESLNFGYAGGLADKQALKARAQGDEPKSGGVSGLARSALAGVPGSFAATAQGMGQIVQQADIAAADSKVDNAERHLRNINERLDSALQGAPEGQHEEIRRKYASAISEREQALGTATQAWAKREPNKVAGWLRERGVDLKEVSQSIDVAPEQRTWANDVAGGVGSMLSYLGPGLVARAVTRGSMTAGSAAALGMAAPAGVSEAYDRAVSAGLSEDEALERSMGGLVAGAIQVAPLASLIKPLPKEIQGKAIGQLYGVLRTGGAEATVEGAGAILQNIIEQGYNAERGTWDDVGYRAAIGGGAGGVTQAATQLATRGRGAGATGDEGAGESPPAAEPVASGSAQEETPESDSLGLKLPEGEAETSSPDAAAAVTPESIDLIRRPRFELSSAEREARDSLAYGKTFKALRASAEAKNDTEAVAELEAASEEVSDLLENEALMRTRGESLDVVRDQLGATADRFASAIERVEGGAQQSVGEQDTQAEAADQAGQPGATREYGGGNEAWRKAWQDRGVENPDQMDNETTISINGEQATPTTGLDMSGAADQASQEPAGDLLGDTPSNAPTDGRLTPQRVPVDQIEVDPDAYQFRTEVDKAGVDSRLKGVEKWDDLRAGNLLLHEREDGRIFAADGHHRISLARQLNQPDVNAIVLRESDGVTVEDARRQAAEANIADGNATATDAAKVFKNSEGKVDDVIRDRNLPSRSQVVRDGADIARLGDVAFGAVLNKVVSEKDGAAIGRSFDDSDQQVAAVDAFQSVNPENENQRALLVNEVRQAGFAETQGDQGGLFGDDPATSLIGDRVRVMDKLRQTLVRDRRLFATLNDNAKAVEKAGNRIARKKNEALQDASAQAVSLLERATTTPEINQQINDAARRVNDGEKVATVARELKETLLRGNDTKAAQPVRSSAPDGQQAKAAGQVERGNRPAPRGDDARTAGSGESRLDRAEGARAGRDVTLKANGKPFQTRRAAELSKAYRDTPGAAAIEVEGGWGFSAPTEESTPLLETYTEQDLSARDRDTQQAEQDQAAQRRQESERAQADAEVGDFGLTGSDRSADVAASRGQDPLFSFAGERAQGASQRALGTAKERIESGEDAEAVRRETGWFQGKDDRWRFEISDDDAAFLPFADGSAGELWTKSLDEVIDHPKLFAAYPDLRNIDVLSSGGMGNLRGQYRIKRNEILINSERDAMDQFSTLLHEVQHGIQHAEGFATGGNPKDYRLPPMREKWLRDRVRELTSESGEFAREVLALYKAGEITSDQAQKRIQKRADEIGLNELRQKLREGDERGAYRYYQRLAGEVEARNVQARQGMSDAERAATSPLDTADVPQNEAVVVYNGKALEQAPPPANADPAVPPNGAPYVSDVSRRMAGHPELAGVQSVQSVTELPAQVLDAMEARGVDAGKVAGAYDPTTGESFVVADNLMDAEEGVRRAVHEAVGHQGIHGVLGSDIDKVMAQVYQSYRRSGAGNETLREIQRNYPHLNPETQAGRMGIAEELVARSIERSDGRPALRERVMAAIRRALRTLFPGVAWTDADIRVLGERSRRHMASRQAQADRNPNDPATAMGLRSVVRGNRGAAGVSAREAQAVVDAFMERYQGNIPLEVRVSATQEELYGPQATVANVGRLKGAYHPARGMMTIVSSNAHSVRDIQRTLRHEVLGHYGLNTFKPAEKRAVLDRVLETQGSRGMEKVWDTVRRHYPDAPRDIQAEEVFAHVAEMERSALGQAWDRVLTGLQRAVRATGLSRAPLRLSELHDLARQIGKGIQEGRRSQQTQPASDDAQFSQEARDDSAIRFSLNDDQSGSVAGPYGPDDSTGFSLPDESWVDAKLRVWADKMRPLKRLNRAIEQAGGTIEEEANPYLTEELYHGRLENDLESFRNTHVEPLADGLAKSGISQAALDDYAYALHAPERNAVVAERNPNDETIQDGGSGMTNAEAAEIVERVERSGKKAEYDRLAKIIHDITAVRRDAIRDGGLETGDVMDAWESAYQHYVPLKGFANDEPEAPRIGKGFQITGKESFMVKGRRDRAASPSTQAIVDANMAIIRRRKNEVGNAFLSMATDHPNQELWEVFTDDRPDTESATVRVTDPETGNKKWEVREQPVQMARDDRYFKTKRAGRTYYIKVKDQRLLNAMRNVGPESNYWITRVAGSATRIMSSLMTSYSPEFLVTNFERDIQTALLNVGAEQTRDDGKIKGQRMLRATARDVRPAMRAAWRGLNRSQASNNSRVREWDQWFSEFIEDGAKTGHFDMKDIDAQAKEIAGMVRRADGKTLSHMLKARKKTADFVENINGAVENAVRLSAYTNARRNGLSRKQAASLAKNLTVNFNRRGEIGTGLNAAYMFANASIQGTMNFARVMVTLKDTPDGKSPMNVWSRANLGQKIGFGMASAAFAMAALNRWLSDEDEDGVLFYDKIPDHVKERHYVMMTGWLTGNPEDYVKIPLPYGYNVFAVAGTHAEAVMSGVESPGEFGKNLGLAVAGSFSPIGFEDSESLGGMAAKNLTPTLVRSITQLGRNEDFAARLIYRENDPFGIPSPESALYMRSTPGAYKAISRVLNDITGGTQNISGWADVSPDAIQHLVNYYGGGAWSFAEKTADFAARSVSGDEVENYRVPFVGKVLGNVTPYQDQSLFYQRRNELGQVFKEAESLTGREGVDYRADNRGKIRLYLDAVDISNNLRDLRKERDTIEVSENLSDAVKRKRRDDVEARMKFQVDRFNRQYNALEE